jgi:hypothetical protein
MAVRKHWRAYGRSFWRFKLSQATVAHPPSSEPAARLAVFQWLENLPLRYGEIIPKTELDDGVPFAGLGYLFFRCLTG